MKFLFFLLFLLVACSNKDFLIQTPQVDNTSIRVTFDHAAISTNNCTACHSVPQVKPIHGGGLDCINCHITSSWLTFQHSSNDTNCISCHNGTIGSSKINSHIPTELQCSTCHNQISFNSTTVPVHSVVDTTDCQSCHSGNTTATGKVPSHIATTQQCSKCHNLENWTTAAFNHASSDTNCLQCHDGNTASAKPLNHTLNGQCSSCHNQTDWTVISYQSTYSHTNTIIPVSLTKNHPKITNCSYCHSQTTDSVNWIYTSISTKSAIINPKGSCAGCHLNYYNSAHGVLTNTNNANCLNCHHTGYTGF